MRNEPEAMCLLSTRGFKHANNRNVNFIHYCVAWHVIWYYFYAIVAENITQTTPKPALWAFTDRFEG
jgi:arginine exporter protein ArgO